MKLELEIDRRGSLWFLLSALLGAYNRRTDALINQDQRQLNQLTERHRKAIAKLKAAVDNTKGE